MVWDGRRWSRRRLLTAALHLPAAVGLTAGGTAAQQATPAAGALDGFAEMLALAPDVLAAPERPAQLAQYGNVPIQVAAVGAEQPSSRESEAFSLWVRAVQWIALPDPVVTHGLLPEFRELLGFDLLQVDEGLLVGAPPETITYVRGRFDAETLRQAWTAAGYRRLDEAGAEIYSLAEGPEFDVNQPVQQIALARFNNVTMLADGTLVFTPSLDRMRQVLAVVAGQEPPLAVNPEVAALLSTVDQPLASALLLDGALLDHTAALGERASPEVVARLEAELEQTGAMPPTTLMLAGVTPGGPVPPPPGKPDATPTATPTPGIFVIRLLMADAAAAETAAETTAKRLETLTSMMMRVPYTELVTARRVEAVVEPPVVVVDLGFVTFPGIWLRMIGSQDLLFLAS